MEKKHLTTGGKDPTVLCLREPRLWDPYQRQKPVMTVEKKEQQPGYLDNVTHSDFPARGPGARGQVRAYCTWFK